MFSDSSKIKTECTEFYFFAFRVSALLVSAVFFFFAHNAGIHPLHWIHTYYISYSALAVEARINPDCWGFNFITSISSVHFYCNWSPKPKPSPKKNSSAFWTPLPDMVLAANDNIRHTRPTARVDVRQS